MSNSNKRKRTVWLAGATLIAAIVAGGAALRQVGATEPLRRLPTPKYMSAETVAEFKSRMARHGNTMSNLVRAVVLIDRPTIRTLAGRIGDEEILARAGATSNETSRFPLPQDFFDQQDTLRTSAQDLAVAAAVDGDDKALADHFGKLARTCVACHSVYLRHDPKARPAGGKLWVPTKP